MENTFNFETATREEIVAEMERLKAEAQRLKSVAQEKVSLKVSEKGAISLYGLGRFPVTLYPNQWVKVIEHGDEIKRFAEQNKALLSQGRVKAG